MSTKEPLQVARRRIIKKTIEEHGQNAWRDKDGYIGNRWTSPKFWIDPGDSLQRAGMESIADALNPDVKDKHGARVRLDMYKTGKGLYVRRPNSDEWWSNLNTTTGDQLRSAMVAMSLLGMKKDLMYIGLRLLSRLGFYWNTRDTGPTNVDKKKMPGWSGPEHWNIILRGLLPESIVAKLLLLPGDVVGLLSTIHATFIYPKDATFKDQLNRLATLLQGVKLNPTPLSKLSMYLFRKYRPSYKIQVDKNWTRTYTRDDKLNPGLFVLEAYFWHKNIDPPIEQGYWRTICLEYFGRK